MKSKFIKYGLFLPVACLLLPACEEQIVNKYEAAPSLSFYNGNSNNKGSIQRDSLNYSFFLAGSRTVDTVWLDVRLTGKITDQDRPITIVQTNADKPNAAIAGRDYQTFDTPDIAAKMVMAANQISASVPIVVNRTAAMESTEYRLDLELAPNSHFVEGFYDKQTFTIKITAMASQPGTWVNVAGNGYFDTFGVWGQEKMRFIIDYVGFSDFEETLAGMQNLDLRYLLNLKVRQAMEEYLLTNPVLKEADDTVVEFPRL